MRALFVDTSAWYPIAVSNHPEHERLAGALRSAVEAGRTIVTSNLVVAESYVLLLRRASRRTALAFLRSVRRAPTVVEYVTQEREEAALTGWIERFEDQDFSLTDATSFAIMEERGISDALALDHHFSVAGFQLHP